MGWDRLMVGLKRWICWSMGGSIGLIIGSFYGGFGDDFFWMGLLWWRCFSFGLVLVSVFSSTLSHSLTHCWPKQGPTKAWQWWCLLINDGVSHDGDHVFLGIFDGLDFKSAAWFSDRWLRWWVWWLLLAPTGLMVNVCVALLMVWWFVFVCVWLCW